MMEAVLCIEEKFQAGKEDLLDRMARFFKRKIEAVVL